jgi:hypothetical protein
MIDLEDVERRVRRGEDIENVLSDFGWKDFEQAVEKIFAENGYHTSRNVRIKTGRRYEIDVVATGRGVAFCVDCKQWQGGRYKRAAIVQAAKDQSVRTEQLKKFVFGNPIASFKLGLAGKLEFRPLIVTLLDEAISGDEASAKVVPLWKLNSYINLSE